MTKAIPIFAGAKPQMIIPCHADMGEGVKIKFHLHINRPDRATALRIKHVTSAYFKDVQESGWSQEASDQANVEVLELCKEVISEIPDLRDIDREPIEYSEDILVAVLDVVGYRNAIVGGLLDSSNSSSQERGKRGN